MLRTDGCTGAFGPRAGILRRSGAWSIGTSSRAGDSDLETLAFLLIMIDLGFLDAQQPPVASLFSFRFSLKIEDCPEARVRDYIYILHMLVCVLIYIYTRTYIYSYLCVCVCVCVCV